MSSLSRDGYTAREATMHLLMLCALEVWALPGGGAPSLYRTLRAYSDRGHRVTVIAPTIGANRFSPTGRMRDIEPAPPPDIPNVQFDRFHLPSLQESGLPMPGLVVKADQKLRFALLFPRLAAARAQQVLDHYPVDVVYAYEVHAALAAARLSNRPPTVARFQGTVMHPALSDPLARLRKYEEVRALRMPADLYIMTDDGTQGDQVLARLNPSATKRLRFWRNGLDLDRLHAAGPIERAAERRALGIDAGAFVMVTASRLAAWKRVDRAIGALPEVARRVPNVLLLIVGDGEERRNLEVMAQRFAVADKVRFAGSVPQEDVAQYMRAADVFVALADLSNVGNPLLEAMCSGLPVVAVDAGDTRSLVRDGETGRLIASGDDMIAVAAATVALAHDTELRGRLAAGARRYADEHFWTWDDRMRAEVDEVERLAGVAPAAGAIEGVRSGRA